MRGPKTSEKKPKNQFFGPILTISLQFNKNCQISDALLWITSVVKISNKFHQISWGYIQETKKPTYKVISTTSVSLTWNKKQFSEITTIQQTEYYLINYWWPNTILCHLRTRDLLTVFFQTKNAVYLTTNAFEMVALERYTIFLCSFYEGNLICLCLFLKLSNHSISFSVVYIFNG